MGDKIEIIKSSPQVFYEVAMKRLDAQMGRMEAIDRKVSSIIGFARTIIAVVTAALQMRGFTQVPQCVFVLLGLAGASYITLTVFAIRAYKFREWDFRPNLEALRKHCMSYDELTMKQWVAKSMGLAIHIVVPTLQVPTAGKTAVDVREALVNDQTRDAGQPQPDGSANEDALSETETNTPA